MNKSEAYEISDDIVKCLFAIKNERGISAYKISQLTGLSQSTIGNIENFTQKPTMPTFLMIADAIGITFVEFALKYAESQS